jgi:hypothetical protein
MFVTFFAGGRVQKMRHTLLAPGQIRGPADAGYQDIGRMLRRVTQTPFIAGPLGLRDDYTPGLPTHKSKSLAARHRDYRRCCQTHAFFIQLDDIE